MSEYQLMGEYQQMSDDLRTRIMALLKAHPDRMDGTCHGSGEPFIYQSEWAAHLADLILTELTGDPTGLIRYQSEWNNR